MGVDLLKHNQEAFQEINKMIESGIKKIAAPRATGSGKTYLMGALAEQYNNDKKLVLEPTRPLLNEMWVHSPPLGAQANFNRTEKHDTM